MSWELLWWLSVGHAFSDFVLQSEWMARAKNRHRPTSPPPGQTPQTVWPYVLTAHALMHGGVVALATGSVRLGVAEAVLHWCIDFGKCENWYGIHADQGMHWLCKIAWWRLA